MGFSQLINAGFIRNYFTTTFGSARWSTRKSRCRNDLFLFLSFYNFSNIYFLKIQAHTANGVAVSGLILFNDDEAENIAQNLQALPIVEEVKFVSFSFSRIKKDSMQGSFSRSPHLLLIFHRRALMCGLYCLPSTSLGNSSFCFEEYVNAGTPPLPP